MSADGSQSPIAETATTSSSGQSYSTDSQSSPAETSSAPQNANKAVYAASPVAQGDGTVTAGADKLTKWGSIDECGSRNGQGCQTGLCCSINGYVPSHFYTSKQTLTLRRYCGTKDEYCGNGCQSQFGTCTASQMHKHYHLRRSQAFGRNRLSL